MPIAVTATKNALADAYKALGSYISLHTSDPGTSGTGEASGGSYARKQTAWGTSSNGTVTGSQVQIDAQAGTYTFAGIWSAASGGSFVDKVAIPSTTLGAPGQVQVTPSYTQT